MLSPIQEKSLDCFQFQSNQSSRLPESSLPPIDTNKSHKNLTPSTPSPKLPDILDSTLETNSLSATPRLGMDTIADIKVERAIPNLSAPTLNKCNGNNVNSELNDIIITTPRLTSAQSDISVDSSLTKESVTPRPPVYTGNEKEPRQHSPAQRKQLEIRIPSAIEGPKSQQCESLDSELSSDRSTSKGRHTGTESNISKYKLTSKAKYNVTNKTSHPKYGTPNKYTNYSGPDPKSFDSGLTLLKSTKRNRPKTESKYTVTLKSGPCADDLLNGRNLYHEQFLPRRSFFSSHDDILRDAGHNVNEYQVTAENCMRHKAMKLRLLQNQRSEQYRKELEAEKAIEQENENKNTESSSNLLDVPTKRVRKTSKVCLDVTNDPNIKVDPSRLIAYLRYIYEHEDEYKKHQKSLAAPSERKPVEHLLKVCQVYSKGPQIDCPTESLPIRAAYELSFRRPPSAIKTKEPHNSDDSDDEEDTQAQLTSFERLRLDVETWILGVSQAQFLKAREMAIKQLGLEDNSIRKWWVAHRHCRYLRHRGKSIET